MKRSAVAIPGPRRARGAPRSAGPHNKPLQPPVATKSKPASCVLSAAPYVPSVDQNLECCLLSLRDCLSKMKQTEVTDRAIRMLDRALKLL